MRVALIEFPGTNRAQDLCLASKEVLGVSPLRIWSEETTLPPVDLILLPGGYAYGDYLRPGAIAAHAGIMRDLKKKAAQGVAILGICNGFQILLEAGLLPGALIRNRSLRFTCRQVQLETVRTDTPFSCAFQKGQIWSCPVAHHDGCYVADSDLLKALEENGQIVLRYARGSNPNGSLRDIAGVCSPCGRIMGMMPHPENRVRPLQGGTEGRLLFEGLLHSFAENHA